MQTPASDLEYVLLNKLVPFELDEDELHELVDATVAHVNELLYCCKTGSQGGAEAHIDQFFDEIASDWDRCLTSEEPIARLWQAVIESLINWLSEDVDLNTYNDTNRKYLGNSIIVLVGMVYADAHYYRAGLSTFETGIAHADASTSRAGPSTSEARAQDAASDTSDDADVLSSTHSNSSGAYSDCTEDKKGKSRRTADYKGKPRWLENIHYDQNGSGNEKENDGQNTPQKRKADEVFNTNDDKIVASPRKKPWEQDSIAETGFLGIADEPRPDKEAGEEMDMDKAKYLSVD
ncbi:hypothetical protein GCG54_00011492 [Colletotrichum gloeosporioides]|uniref:Uncharacterized protein n=1 Tax=Colletotrichum gloeosporioides TaxID=474922 RepID=A0A8H4CT01_COLGL|nr:uncharacterized protein GCG54_00011492 [Colletotrichum gloeosporioides]KAF3809296.1 hypothetical protein GCG54_00011492 [Colletotrichum gloeosporioides]